MKPGLRQLAFLALATIGSLSLAHASQRDELNSDITKISTTTNALQADVPAAFSRLNAKANLIQNKLDNGSLLIGDYVAGKAGDPVTLPFILVPSSFPIADIQADIVIPFDFTVSSVTTGEAALAAQKIVSTNTVNGVERFLIFGLNRNIIPQGEVLLLNLIISPTTPIGLYSIVIDNPIASDPDGKALLMSVMSGIVEVTQ